MPKSSADPDDRFDLTHPEGIEMRWLSRSESETPGANALEAVRFLTTEDVPDVHAFVVGEQALVQGARRHLVSLDVPKDRISFVGYWKLGAAH